MWNIDVLEELNFWRAFFFDDRPRLIIPFGEPSLADSWANLDPIRQDR